MNRRDLLRFLGISVLSASLTPYVQQKSVFAQTKPNNKGVSIQWLGHSCFLFTDNNIKILVNPFLPIGCTAKYKPPKVAADVVMISSRLLDEGYAVELVGNPKIIADSGIYKVNGVEIQGINTLHDREKGRRFGINVAWRWQQGGITILNLGGIASPIGIEQKILMGSPDLTLMPVGGGDKIYTPQEAFDAMKVLNSKVLIPTQYLTAAADKDNCTLLEVNNFLDLAKAEKMNIKMINSNKLSLKNSDLPPKGTLIRVLDSTNNLNIPNISKK